MLWLRAIVMWAILIAVMGSFIFASRGYPPLNGAIAGAAVGAVLGPVARWQDNRDRGKADTEER